ncbi:MAG: barstar family protein [Treponema sp.]|nr:barstar family protein [Treponema sp.]
MLVTIDFGSVDKYDEGKARLQVHDLLKTHLKFPDYYGCNLDALYDVLLDPHDPWTVRFLNCRLMWENHALYMEDLKETFADAAAEGAAVSAEWYA